MHIAKPQRICPKPEGTPSTSAGTSGGRVLPNDVLQEASRRLGIISMMAAVLWFVVTALDHVAIRVINHDESRWKTFQFNDWVALLTIVISLGLYFFTRQEGRRPEFILDLGLGYMVFTALVLGILIHNDPSDPRVHAAPMVTWVGAVILISAAIVPNSPKKMLVAGMMAASMNPMAMIISKWRGVWDYGSNANVLLMHYPDFILAGVAVVISQVVMRLGHQVSKAREMGSYQLLDQLGKGGMGEVWRARHRMLARDAAIKLIQPEHLSGTTGNDAVVLRRRFEQEAKATATLRSPHTVELYDFGVTEDGVFYYVMELLEGIDLETLVKKFGPQPAGRVAWILRQACRSLEDAHRHGMVHRDIKPSNLFICRMGTELDFTKVLDFGLVKLVDGTGLELSHAGATTGTPTFMAPELALGHANLDGRTDLYSLGCVGYWLLTGKLVFEETSATATMLAHVRKDPVPPSQRTELPVSHSLERAIMMCLAKEPQGRPDNADALARLLEGEIGDWTEENAERWWAKNLPRG